MTARNIHLTVSKIGEDSVEVQFYEKNSFDTKKTERELQRRLTSTESELLSHFNDSYSSGLKFSFSLGDEVEINAGKDNFDSKYPDEDHFLSSLRVIGVNSLCFQTKGTNAVYFEID